MEDIAEHRFDISGTLLSTPKYSFNFDKQFEEIGIRFGFALDTKLILDSFNAEYKNTWIQYFNDINISQNIDEVDKIEDCLIEIVQNNVNADNAFFLNALETGSLPQEWIEKIIILLNPPPPPDEITIISHANIEKPINIRRRLATTRRTHSTTIPNKKILATTRRRR
jgi:hypothetical protein